MIILNIFKDWKSPYVSRKKLCELTGGRYQCLVFMGVNFSFLGFNFSFLALRNAGFQGELPKKKEYFKSKSYKMGDDFGLDALDEHIKENTKIKKEDVIEAYQTAVQKERTVDFRTKISSINKEVQEEIDVVIEPKHHTVKKEESKKQEPKEKTAEELAQERDNRLKDRFTILAGFDFFKDHTTWETKDNFQELLEERDARWEQFKGWYPDDYEERLNNNDISEPKPVNESVDAISETASEKIPAETPVKSHTEGVSGYKHSKKMAVQRALDASQPEKRPVAVPRRPKDDQLQRQIDEAMAYGEKILQNEREKKAMKDLNDWYNKKY